MMSQEIADKLGKPVDTAVHLAGDGKAERLAYTKRETCALLGIGETTLWRLEKRGLVRAVPHLRIKIYPRAELERFLRA